MRAGHCCTVGCGVRSGTRNQIDAFIQSLLSKSESQLHLSAKMKDGKAMEMDGRHTAIWNKRGGGRWLILHDQWSAPMVVP